MFRCLVLVSVVCLLLSTAALQLLAAPTAEQREEIQAATELMVKAGALFNQNKFPEAGEAVKEAQEHVIKAADDADQATLAQLAPIHKRMEQAHAILKSKNVDLPPLEPLPATKTAAKTAAKPTTAKPAPGKKPAEKTTAKTTPEKSTAKTDSKTPPGKAGAAGSVSFVNDVAPILNSRCGGCHVRNARGEFSMNTFDLLIKGPPKSGKVIFPGDVKSSVLIEKVQEKEMPPNGAGIPDAELAKLKKWVEEGAKFDGKDRAAQLTTYVTPSNAAATNSLTTVRQATGKETISFARDIAPMFVKSCVGCHGRDQPRNDFNLSTMTTLLRGGERGEPVLPGKPADSLLIKKLRGTADGQRMPQRGAAFSEEDIKKVETWIAEGARYDAPDPAMQLTVVASIAKAQASTHEQLTKDRAKLAEENWRLGMPGTTASKFERDNFLVMGSVGENTLEDIAKRAEALAPKVGEIFKASPGQPLVKGRVTLFVFGERYDYGEFGKMVEKHDLPAAARGHHKYTIVDAYGVVLTPKTPEYDFDTLIAQQLAAVYVASLGKNVPHWFAEGCGRVAASRMAPGSDRRVAQWDIELSGIVGSLAKPDDFINGKMPPENADVCSASFAKFLMSNSRQFPNLMDALRKGADFKKAFADTMGGDPEKLAAVWVRDPPKMGRGGRAKK